MVPPGRRQRALAMRLSMNAAAPVKKGMTEGEAGTAAAFAVLACTALIVSAKAYTPEYAFHATLFMLGSVAAVFAIFNRYFDRPAEPAPQFIDGKPNYNMGPVKFATVAAVVWGIAGFTVGLYAALELAFPVLNFDLPWISFGRIRPLHTSAVIFAFGGNVLIATSFYVFQPFITTKPLGMGVGLSISRSIVESHGGQIRCETNTGGGTVFRFTAPKVTAGEVDDEGK
jgi:cytochrome c oxidase cbb3-type subunit I